MRQHLARVAPSIRTDFQKRPAIDSEQGDDQRYWTVTTDYLFAVRVLRGRTFLYETINPAMRAVLGASSNGISGTPVSDCLGTEDARSIYKAFRACLGEGGQVRIRHRLAFGGSLRDFETIATPVFDPDTGSVTKLLGSHRDVSSYSSGGLTECGPDVNGRDNTRLVHIQEDIQQRIASDLHDSTCQYLIAASLGMMRVRTALGDPAMAERLFDEIDTSIDLAIKEIRAFAYLLHPRNLVDGLKVSIEQYARGFSVRTALKVKTRISPEIDRLPYKGQHSLLRIVQEALTNVFRHAKATEVEISGKIADNHFELRISDNGCGIAGRAPDGTSASLGVGIPAMRARLQQMGGRLEIWSAPGRRLPGTTLCAIIPHHSKRRKLDQPTVATSIRTRPRTEIKVPSPNMQSEENRAPGSAAK
ncbi:ATP-binding protein [Bradyrhizobium ganzhouense]|uniref:sensor histidine kinase n=1 Tax=Bradyrhizobium ganzhouense TaxID=1179767 RepID=UPI003CE8B41E